jgi:hypothetical protein
MDPGTPAKITLGALLEPLFRQFLYGVLGSTAERGFFVRGPALCFEQKIATRPKEEVSL